MHRLNENEESQPVELLPILCSCDVMVALGKTTTFRLRQLRSCATKTDRPQKYCHKVASSPTWQTFWNTTGTFWKISSRFNKNIYINISQQSMPTSTQPHINQSCKTMKNDLISVSHRVFHSSLPLSQHIHLLPLSPHLSGPLHLCQTALWAVASQVTWANRRLYIPAEHYFALREFPPLSLPLSSPFVSVCVLP